MKFQSSHPESKNENSSLNLSKEFNKSKYLPRGRCIDQGELNSTSKVGQIEFKSPNHLDVIKTDQS